MSKANSPNWTRRPPRMVGPRQATETPKGQEPLYRIAHREFPFLIYEHREGTPGVDTHSLWIRQNIDRNEWGSYHQGNFGSLEDAQAELRVRQGRRENTQLTRVWKGEARPRKGRWSEKPNPRPPQPQGSYRKSLGEAPHLRKDLCLRPGNHLSLGGEEVFVVSVSPDNRTAQVRFGNGKMQTVSLRENPQQGKALTGIITKSLRFGGGRKVLLPQLRKAVEDKPQLRSSHVEPGTYPQQMGTQQTVGLPKGEKFPWRVIHQSRRHHMTEYLIGGNPVRYYYIVAGRGTPATTHPDYESALDHYLRVSGESPPTEEERAISEGKSLRRSGKAVEDKPQLRSSHIEPGTHPHQRGTQETFRADKGERFPTRILHRHPTGYRLMEHKTGDHPETQTGYLVGGPNMLTTHHQTYESALCHYQSLTGEVGGGKSLRKRGKAANPPEMTQHLGGIYPRHRGIQEGGELEKGARQNFRIIHHRDGVRLAEIHSHTRQVQGMPLQTVRQFVVGGLGMVPTYHQDYESALSHYRDLTGETREELNMRRRGKMVPDKPQLRSSYIAPGTYPHTPGSQQSIGTQKGSRAVFHTVHRYGGYRIVERARGLEDQHEFIVQHEQTHHATRHQTLEEARHQLASNLGWDRYLSGHPRRSSNV